jgi:flagellar hook-associated protein 3 FlgL
MKTTDSALGSINEILHRIRELVVDVANEVKEPADMKTIGVEILELRKQIEMITNTVYGSQKVFAGRNVTESPYQDGKWVGNNELLFAEIGVANVMAINITNKDMNNFFTGDQANLQGAEITFPLTGPFLMTVRYKELDGTVGATLLTVNPPAGAAEFASIKELNEAVGLELYKNGDLANADLVVTSRAEDGYLVISCDSTRLTGVEDGVNGAYTDAEPFSIFTLIDKIVRDIDNADVIKCSGDLDLIDLKFDDLLTSRATMGGRTNRLELQLSRLSSNEVSYTELLSQNEDTDMAEVIMLLQMQENVYQASLAVGARIIQPTLVDYLS